MSKRLPRRTLLGALFGAPVTVRAAALLRVSASFSILADMTRQIAGDLASVHSLVPVDGDAHTFQPHPGDLRELTVSQLLIENGLGLEGWMTRLRQAANYRGPVVTASAGIQAHTMTEDGKAIADPHAWQDPRNGEVYATNITGGLIAADGVHASRFRAAGQAYVQKIRDMDIWMTRSLADIPPERRKIITTHDAFGYFGARYAIEFRAAEGLSTDAEPSAQAIATLIAQIKRDKIKAVFIENMTDPRIAKMLARETGAVLGGTVYSDALSARGGPADTYLNMFRHNVTLFTAAMRAD